MCSSNIDNFVSSTQLVTRNFQRITKNPNDALGYALLLGEGYDLATISEYVTDADLDSASGGGVSNGNGNGNGNGSGTKKEVKTEVAYKPGTNETGGAGTTNTKGITQVDKTASLKDQARQKIKAEGEVKLRIAEVFKIIGEDYISWTRDENLPKADFDKQQIRDAAVDWLKSNRTYFYKFPEQLAAFEDDPEGWVQTKLAPPTTGLKSTKLDGKD